MRSFKRYLYLCSHCLITVARLGEPQHRNLTLRAEKLSWHRQGHGWVGAQQILKQQNKINKKSARILVTGESQGMVQAPTQYSLKVHPFASLNIYLTYQHSIIFIIQSDHSTTTGTPFSVLNIVANPHSNPNMEPIDLPVVSMPNTRYIEDTKTIREESKLV